MSVKRTILKGTLILTITGFATRFMGFFYRIFLSHTFGEERSEERRVGKECP